LYFNLNDIGDIKLKAAIELEKIDDYAIIHLSGSFFSGEDHDYPKEIKTLVKDLITENILKIFVDFENVVFFGSDGIGALTNGHYTVWNAGGRFIPYCFPTHIKKAFSIVGLDKIFPFFDTFSEAKEYIDSKVK
jgi:anti-anti-sigma factor